MTISKTSFSVGFIGGGNMARSIIGGLRADETLNLELHVFDPSVETLKSLEQEFNTHSADSNQAMLDNCDVIVLAVKPQAMQSVLTELDASNSSTLFISIAAGLTIRTLSKWLGSEVALIRTMPNTPALVQCGATGLYANNAVSSDHRDLADIIIKSTGIGLWVDSEDLLDAVTALSGSGPAYYFLVMEAMQAAAEKLGLSTETARELTLQTALGAASLAKQSTDTSAELRQRVTSPNGTTEEAINSLIENDLLKIFEQAMQAAYKRSKELAIELDQT